MLEPDSVVLQGRFKVLRRLGGGGMGDVYLAEQVSLGRRVALKVLKRELNTQPGMEARFRREAQLLSSVDHPAVVRVIDFGQADGMHYLVMELAEGETLLDALKAGPMSPHRALPLLAQLCDGLAAIHGRGIIHRDLKPENVVLTKTARGEQARLLDFGIAKIVEGGEPGVTQIGVVMGTPEYLSPEQATGAKVDARSDLYAFGVLMYRTLSGRLPFLGPSPRQFLAQHVAAPPVPLGDALRPLKKYPALCAVVMRCLEKEPSLRPQTARALSDTLANLAVELGASTPLLEESHAATTGASRTLPASTGTAAFGTVETRPSSTGTAAFGTVAPPPPVLVPARTSPLANAARPQNLTLVLTDIVGFTARTSRQTREENARMLEEHDALLLPVFKAYGGRVLQKRGDAFLVGFPSPTQSVLCGMELQDKLWRRNHVLGGEPLQVRVAIHVGDVLLDRDGPVGEPVQVIAAVEKLAGAGEVVFTEAVNLAMNRAEVPSEERGTLHVPGRGEQMRVYRCRPAGEGPPFGGRDLKGAAAPPKARRRTRRIAALATGVLFVVGGGFLVPLATTPSAVREARSLLEEGRAGDALAALDAATVAPESADAKKILRTRAVVLHALRRHGDEWSALRAAGGIETDSAAVDALLEDYARDDDAALKKLLATLPERSIRARVASAPQELTQASWGAVLALDTRKALEPGEALDAYVVALGASECGIRGAAARRLADLGDLDAVGPLEALAATPKLKDPNLPFLEKNCGQDEASAALRALKRRTPRG